MHKMIITMPSILPPLLLIKSFWLLIVIAQHPIPAHAFSASSDGIKIVGLPGGQIQSLPAMYVQTFRRWIVEDNNDNEASDESGRSSSCASLQMEPIKGAGHSISNLPEDEGYVNPTTTSELWWPADLSTLQIRPMLNVLFRNGVLSYISAGLDVRVPHKVEGGDDKEIITWRNYGLNSQPIARQWTSLDIAMEKLFHVEGFVLHTTPGTDSNNEDTDQTHDVLFPSLDAATAMQKVATFISELDTLSPLAEGFHIASFPMMEHWTDLPTTPKIESETMNEDGTAKPMYKIVCMATSEPFANKLLDMDEDLLTMSSTSVLEVEVCRTVGGGDSPYLTEPYKALYLSKS